MLKQRREFYNRIRPNQPVAVLYAGQERCAPGHRSEGARPHFLLHYVLDGTGTVRLTGPDAQLKAGDAFLFGPGPHAYRASLDTPWHYAWVGFAGEAAESMLRDIGVSGATVFRGEGVLPQMRDHLFDLISTLRIRAPGFSTRSDGYLLLILSHLYELAHASDKRPKTPPPRPETYVNEALNFIHTNFQRDIDVGSVVEYVGLERSYFSDLFHRKTGQSVQDYLITYRMRKAREYLRDSGYSIQSIASSVGYGNYFSFARRFKKVTGRTPTEFREREGS